MKRFRARRVVICGGLLLLAVGTVGCAQIAGLSGDYQLASSAGGPPSVAGASASSAGQSSAQAGASSAAAGSDSGSAGLSGDSGTAQGPVRVGYSEFHDSGSGSDGASAGSTDATFDTPEGIQSGDFILVFFGADHSLKLSGNDPGNVGWTLHDDHHEYGTDGQATYLLYRFASSNEPDKIVFAGINSAQYGNGVQGLLSVYRGVNGLKPINAYEVNLDTVGGDGTSFNTATPAITTTADNCLLIAGLSPDTAIDRPAIVLWPTGFTENQLSVLNPANPHPDGWASIYSAERHLANAGTLDASAFGWKSTAGSNYYGALAFVLALAP